MNFKQSLQPSSLTHLKIHSFLHTTKQFQYKIHHWTATCTDE